MTTYQPGDKVRYQGRENGIVKASSIYGWYVVFNCGGDWENYKNYTAAQCAAKDLKHGWV